MFKAERSALPGRFLTLSTPLAPPEEPNVSSRAYLC